MFVYIYIYRERERYCYNYSYAGCVIESQVAADRALAHLVGLVKSAVRHIDIIEIQIDTYIYIYIERERDREICLFT